MIRAGLAALSLLCAVFAAHGQVQWIRLDSVAPSAEAASGYWRAVPDGAIFLCEPRPGHSGTYSLQLLYSPELSLRPGTPFGTMTAAGRPGVFDARLMLDPSGRGAKDGFRTFTIEMNEEADRMLFRAYKNRLKVNFNRWLPYLFRVSVSQENTRPADTDGAVRIDGSESGGGNIIIL